MEISQINMMISQAKRSSKIQYQDAVFELQQMARNTNKVKSEEAARTRMEKSVTGTGLFLDITI